MRILSSSWSRRGSRACRFFGVVVLLVAAATGASAQTMCGGSVCPPGGECLGGAFCVTEVECDPACPEGLPCVGGVCGGTATATCSPGCPEGQACTFQGCVPEALACGDEACEPSEECLGGLVCVSRGSCDESGTCLPGEVCVEGTCELAPCGESFCSSGEVCLDGACEVATCETTECPEGEYCVGAGFCLPLPSPCNPIDRQCPDGFVCRSLSCEPDPNHCEPGCASDEICRNRACETAPCAGACGPSEICFVDECLSAVDPCIDDSDCRSDWRCSRPQIGPHFCRPIYCNGLTSCPPGSECSLSNACEPAAECVPGLEVCDGVDNDCDDEVDEGELCAHLDDVCAVGVCTDGACTAAPANDGDPCDDDVVCTDGDRCVAGRCEGVVPAGAIVGTSGADVLVGTFRHDVILGLGGDDIILGQGGADVICAGDGADFVAGGRGGDQIHGGAGDDTLLGEAHEDTIFGGAGDDLIRGGRGADITEGGAGQDRCVPEPGADTGSGCEFPGIGF